VSPNVKLSTSKERSEIMRKIKGRDTKPEIILRKSLWARGYRYRISPKDMPGKPDIVFRKNKLVIFVDGEFLAWI
jgi:DNA mismatch endonuclease (patch repair protein)